jgi:hypothetical protein
VHKRQRYAACALPTKRCRLSALGPFFNASLRSVRPQACILAGCDYLPSPPRVGLRTAIKQVAKFRRGLKAAQWMREDGGLPQGEQARAHGGAAGRALAAALAHGWTDGSQAGGRHEKTARVLREAVRLHGCARRCERATGARRADYIQNYERAQRTFRHHVRPAGPACRLCVLRVLGGRCSR